MKIAHILGSLGMGGAERVALDLAFEQKKLGHEVVAISLAASAGGPMASEFEDAGIVVHQVPKRPGLDRTLPFRVARKLKELGVEVAHTHNTAPLTYAAAAARIAGLAVVHSKHGEGHLVSKAGQFLRRLGAPFVHSFVAVSEATAEHARRQWAYPLPSRIRVITNGIRMDKHHPDKQARLEVRRALGIDDDAWVVGTIGRFDDNKNQSALVRAMAPLLGPKSQLILVGDGESMPKVKAAAQATEHAECIHILGRRNDASRVLAAMDVFALPSLSEGLPLVILEAMATGLAVVSTAVGGIPKVIEDGVNGLLVPANNEGALRERLTTLSADRQMAASLGACARSHVVEAYSAERMASEYLELYRRAIS
jgi:glycosyltransferase involved in cell wall biosynthesis